MQRTGLLLIALVVALLIHAPASATPPPPPREGTDCGAKVYIVDDLVCASEDLMRLDGLARDRNMMLQPSLRPEWPSLVEKQTDWYWRRGKCVDAPDRRRCLDAAYHDRLEVLAALNERPAAGTGEPIACEGPPWGSGRMYVNQRSHNGDFTSMVISNPEGVVMAVVRLPNNDGWTPAVTLATYTLSSIELAPYNGPFILCRREKPNRSIPEATVIRER